MKAKTLSAIAVAAAFGLSASAFAGPGHEVVTPFSPNESGENAIAFQQHASASHRMGSHEISSQQVSSWSVFSLMIRPSIEAVKSDRKAK